MYWFTRPNWVSGWLLPRLVAVGWSSPCDESTNTSLSTPTCGGPPAIEKSDDQSPALPEFNNLGVGATNGSPWNWNTLACPLRSLTGGSVSARSSEYVPVPALNE